MATKKKGRESDKEVKADSSPQGAKPEAGKTNGSAKAASNPPKKEPPKKDADKTPPAKAKPKGENGAKAAAAKNKKKEEDSELGESIKDVRQFLKEVAIEFRKITWPGRRQVVQETYSVLFLVTLITLMVLGFDWFLGKGVFGPLEHFARLHGGGIGRL